MNFIFFVIFSTFIYLSKALCGSQCIKDKIPTGLLSGDIKVVTVNPNINYDISGTITIKNDCEFEIQNFYINPEIKDARWACSPLDYNDSITLTSSIKLVSDNTAKDLIFNVYEGIDGSCHASLLNDCNVFKLYDENWQEIASATIEESKNDSLADDDKFSSNNNQENENDNSGKLDYLLWLYILFGVIGGFSFVSLLALGYIQVDKKLKYSERISKSKSKSNNNNASFETVGIIGDGTDGIV